LIDYAIPDGTVPIHLSLLLIGSTIGLPAGNLTVTVGCAGEAVLKASDVVR
jgi:hypothetical protein